MTRKLSDADRAAVDMMFDRINATGNNAGDAMVTMTTPVADSNLRAVEKVLDVLGNMPAPEPPVDLATRTLARVSQSTGTHIPQMPGQFIQPNQPLA